MATIRLQHPATNTLDGDFGASDSQVRRYLATVCEWANQLV
ncbi:hypothetical protein ACTGXX_02960 [Streptococcus suis]